MRNGMDGLKIPGAYLGGVAIALAIMALFYGLQFDAPFGARSLMLLNTGALAATGALTRQRGKFDELWLAAQTYDRE